MGKKRAPRKRDIKEYGLVVQSAWMVGSRTRAWSELWDRIFREVSNDQEIGITDDAREQGNGS